MTTWVHLIVGCAAALQATAVRLKASRAAPLAFYAIDCLLDDAGQALRPAARRTWLQVVREVGDDYRFFGFNDRGTLDTEAEPDFVTVPAEQHSDSRNIRQFRIITFGLRWGLEHTSATYIVKADHDTFVCAGHLHYEFAHKMYPSKSFFMGDFWHRKGMLCRADEDFLVYTRDVVDLALKDYLINPVLVNGVPTNWAVGWGILMRHLWSEGQLTVADETIRFDSQQDWHDTEEVRVNPTQKIPKDYCRNMIGMHVLTKDTRVFDAIMAGDDRRVDYKPTPPLAQPACMRNCSGEAWTIC